MPKINDGRKLQMKFEYEGEIFDITPETIGNIDYMRALKDLEKTLEEKKKTTVKVCCNEGMQPKLPETKKQKGGIK